MTRFIDQDPPMDTHSVGFEPTATSILITLGGDLDISSSHSLIDHFEQCAKSGLDLHLDLGRVTFLDSSALTALVSGARAAEANGRTLRVVAASETVRRLLTLTGLSEYFGIGNAES